MNISLLGNMIGKFRKALNMTQEELGRAVGVSTQAVSRWECGGAPDISLIPAIADTLHVSIDALFGREDSGACDIKETMMRHIISIPQNRYFDELVDLYLTCIPAELMRDYGVNDIEPMEKAEVDVQGKKQLSRSLSASEFGFLLCSYAKDLRYLLVFPEPEEGYARYFADKEEYRKLFLAFSKPLALEIVLELCSEKERFMSCSAIRKRLKIRPDDLQNIRLLEDALEALHDAKVLRRDELEVEEGVISTYCLPCQENLPFFFILARYITQDGVINYVGGSARRSPWLRKTN